MLQISSSAEGRIESRELALVCTHAQVTAPHEISAHRHSRGQLLFTRNEPLQIRIEQQQWHMAAEQAVWIPSQSEHQLFAPKGAEYFSVYADQTYNQLMPKQAGIVQLSRLSKELVFQSAGFGKNYQNNSAESRLNQVLFDQLQYLQPDNLCLFVPKSPMLKKLCNHLLANPLERISLHNWGQKAGASERHLARSFKKETGLTYRQWRHRLDILYMLEANRKGFNLSYIAADLNYAHASALSKMVKRETGHSPSELINLKRLQN